MALQPIETVRVKPTEVCRVNPNTWWEGSGKEVSLMCAVTRHVVDSKSLAPGECSGGALLGVDVGECPPAALLLASRSPRRRSLLTEAGFSHQVCSPGFEDGPLRPGAVSPSQWVASLAKLKAWAGTQTSEASALLATRDVVVLGADTACVMDGTLIGTPVDANEAAHMVRAFANREHEVVTGVAIVRCTRGMTGTAKRNESVAISRTMFADVARVRMGAMSERELEAYIASNLWQGKAGGYNIAERIANGWDISFTGDQTSIMGLPMLRVPRMLRVFGVRPDVSVQTTRAKSGGVETRTLKEQA